MYEYLDRRYSLALYEVAEEKNKVDEYISQLREIVELIKNNEEVFEFIKHPQISSNKKKEIFKQIFEGKVEPEILQFLLVLISRDRILHLEEKLIELEKIHLERQNKVEAQVKTAVPLVEEEKNALIEKLQKKYNKTIILKEEIDSKIIGGVYIRVGNDVIDGTVKTKLEEMKNLVLSNK